MVGTKGLHHDVFVVLYKIVTFHNAACLCDDGETGAASSHTRTLQCVASLHPDQDATRARGQVGWEVAALA